MVLGKYGQFRWLSIFPNVKENLSVSIKNEMIHHLSLPEYCDNHPDKAPYTNTSMSCVFKDKTFLPLNGTTCFNPTSINPESEEYDHRSLEDLYHFLLIFLLIILILM